MDVFKEKSNCITPVFKNYHDYKKHYNVLDSWKEIEEAILKTYTSPAKTKKMPVQAGPLNALVDSLMPKFYAQTKEAVQNTVYYLHYKYQNSIYVRIRNGHLDLFYYLVNQDYTNPLASHLHKSALPNSKHVEKYSDMGGVIRPFQREYNDYSIGFSYNETKFFLMQLCNMKKIPDCDFVIHHKERLAIKRDLTEASEELVGSINYPLQQRFKKKVYLPIVNFNWNERYADLPMPTPDDILRIFQIYCAPNCDNGYTNDMAVPWLLKVPTAVFRGSFTGASAVVKNNPRLLLAQLSKSWAGNPQYNEKNSIDQVPYLNAGITAFKGIFRPRKDIRDTKMHRLNPSLEKELAITPMTQEDQKKFKYVIYAVGNVSAFRGAFLFSFGSVVLWIRSPKYHLWFEPLLKDWENCVFIEEDLSNLAKVISRLKRNDAEARKIAIAGRDLYDAFLVEHALINYGEMLIRKIASCKPKK